VAHPGGLTIYNQLREMVLAQQHTYTVKEMGWGRPVPAACAKGALRIHDLRHDSQMYGFRTRMASR